MRSRASTFASVAAFLLGCQSAGPSQTAASVLPLRTVRLYETGVGYFERSGTVSGDDQASLPVPAGHLDDALKTLVVLGADNKRTVAGLEFGSSVSRAMGRALAGLPLDADTPVTHFDMLSSLKGAHVEIQEKGGDKDPLPGRVIDVLAPDLAAHKAEKDGKDAKETSAKPGAQIVFAGDDGALRKLDANDVVWVRPTDPAFASRLDAALDALNASASRTPRNLRIMLGHGPITLGYVAETPVWRTTYRIVIGKDDKHTAALQGWALLHNDTDENWKDVRATLVNGRPDSFLFPLAAPRYARRELVTPENQASTVPQLLGRTVDAIWGDHVDDTIAAGGLGLSGVGEGGGGAGYGIGLGSVGTIGHGSGTGSGTSSLLAVGDLANIASATGVESGVLFSYTLGQPLDLRAHGSALVPFVSAKVDAEPIAWLASPTADARAAVRFVNSTPQTLPSGPVAFFADGGFAGEAAIDRLKPNERRFLQFGADLDVELTVVRSDAKETVKRLTFEYEAISLHYLKTTTSEWKLENRSGGARSLYVSIDVIRNATITGADALDYDTHGGHPIAIVKLEPRSEGKRTVVTVEGLSRPMSIAALDVELLGRLAAEPELSASEKATTLELAKKQKELDLVRKALEKTKADLADVEKDTDRLREHLKAAGGEKGLGAPAGGQSPFVVRILAAEDRRTALRKQQETQEAERKVRALAVRSVAEHLASR